MRVQKPFVGIVLPGLFLLACTVSGATDDASKKKERAHSHLIEARRFAADYKIDKAADKAREALKDNPTIAEAHVYLGLERFRANDLKGAEAEFNRALELDGYQAAAHCELGYVLYQQGQIEPATDHWTLATRLDPTSPRALAGVALSQFKQGEKDKALKTFDKVLMYDRRFADSKFLENEKGPKWSGRLLQDFELLLAEVPKPNYP
jgi:tetratricopeptide (TPR) repeat protein